MRTEDSPSPEQVSLQMKNITKLYSGTVALDGVNLTVYKGEVHGIIGKNGAGKSTLVGIMSGIIQPSKGEIIVNGHTYRSLSPIEAKKQHISIITQEPQVIEESTVTENLFMPAYINHKQFINWRELDQRARDILKKVGLPLEVTYKMRDLSISEKQLLLVIKSCYVEQADIIIMDEVSASLTKKDEKILYDIIKERVEAGKTVIFISHRTEELLMICDRVTVLRDGRSVGCARCRDLNLKSLAALIVGNNDYSTMVMVDKSDLISDEVFFEIKNLTSYGNFSQVNISLRKGEIVGLAGLRGSGRTEIFKSVVGIDKYDEGAIYLKGEKKYYSSPCAAEKDGVLYMAEDREKEGLISISSIKNNLTISIMPRVSRYGVFSNQKEIKMADNLIKILNVKAFSRNQEIHQLSGGNKQKVLVGKIMAHNPQVCLLDEPTRGVDIEAKESILHTINEEMRKDSCVLISSPGLDDLIKICDRILILYEGKIIDEFKRNEFNEQDIFRAVQGEIIHVREVVSS